MSGLNETPTGERIHIGLFGRVNAGKSSLMNRLAGQELAVVSEKAGTTTDPVRKSMEILPLGPVTLYDTPGLEDGSALGEKREAKTEEILRKTNLAILVMDGAGPLGSLTAEAALAERFTAERLPFLAVVNKCEGKGEEEREALREEAAKRLSIPKEKVACFSCLEDLPGMGPADLREKLAAAGRGLAGEKKPLVADLLSPRDVVLLVVPIDESAPKGRLILPQQQVIRDALEAGALPLVARPSELTAALGRLKEPPRLVVTDSQAFGEVDRKLPASVPLTSFSILMARYKGDLPAQTAAARRLDSLPDGAKILISEGCVHHRQCGDIGTVKLPAWIAKRTGRDFQYEFTSGGEFPRELAGYGLVIHCGGCVLPEKEMAWRLSVAREAGVPMTNYGVMIAHLRGILGRATAVFE